VSKAGLRTPGSLGGSKRLRALVVVIVPVSQMLQAIVGLFEFRQMQFAVEVLCGSQRDTRPFAEKQFLCQSMVEGRCRTQDFRMQILPTFQ
jgi:hypothetical protein